MPKSKVKQMDISIIDGFMHRRKHRRLRKPLRIALEVIACTAVFVGMIYIFVGAVLQESYKNYPPTDAEIAENQKLEIYRK